MQELRQQYYDPRALRALARRAEGPLCFLNEQEVEHCFADKKHVIAALSGMLRLDWMQVHLDLRGMRPTLEVSYGRWFRCNGRVRVYLRRAAVGCREQVMLRESWMFERVPTTYAPGVAMHWVRGVGMIEGRVCLTK